MARLVFDGCHCQVGFKGSQKDSHHFGGFPCFGQDLLLTSWDWWLMPVSMGFHQSQLGVCLDVVEAKDTLFTLV